MKGTTSCQQVKDLLQEQATHSLRVREHPRTGPYVEGLSKHLVSSFPDISVSYTISIGNGVGHEPAPPRSCTSLQNISDFSHIGRKSVNVYNQPMQKAAININLKSFWL